MRLGSGSVVTRRPDDLQFLVEDGLEVLPTFAVTLSSPGMWIGRRNSASISCKLVHSEQAACVSCAVASASGRRRLRRSTVADRSRPGTRARCSCSSARSATQRSGARLLHIASDPAPARRRRVWRPGGARRAVDHSRAAAGPERPRRRRSAGGADLSTVGRSQSAAHRSRLRQARRVRSADPARPGELRARRRQRSRVSAASRRRDRGAAVPIFRRRLSRATSSIQGLARQGRGDVSGFAGDRKALDQGRISFGGDP